MAALQATLSSLSLPALAAAAPAAATATAAPLGGSLALPGPLVTPAWLAGALGNGRLRLLDVRPADAFADAHIPGAVRVELSSLATRLGGVEGMLLPAPAFARQIGALGVGSQSLVIVYDDQWGMAAARVFWALRRYGHTNVA
ncbi:MAG: rhodanese-like domain-containing protein, partial [Caldilineaceae bacterium]